MTLWGLPLRGAGDNRLYTFLRWVVVLVFGGVYRCRVTGNAHLPSRGPAMVITVHKSLVDPIIAGMVLPRPLRYMAKKELFANPALRRLITHLGAFPVDRGAGDRAALTTSLAILAAGGLLLMFPEGTRRPDDQVHDFLPGVGMIALRSGAPVIPVAVKGTHELVRGRRPGLPKIRASVGPPVDLGGIEGRSSRSYREAARRMQLAVTELYDRL